MNDMRRNSLTSKLRPEIRAIFTERREALVAELSQIEKLLAEDDAHTMVGMPMFAVHGADRQTEPITEGAAHETRPLSPHRPRTARRLLVLKPVDRRG